MEQSCDLTGAQWLGGPGNTLNRKTFTLPRRPRSATLRITADTHHYAREYWMKTADNPDPGNWLLGGSFLKFRIFVNGALAGAGPFRAIRNGNCVVHNFDLLPFLREGENVLGIFSRGEEKGFALRLELDWQDGTREAVLSDNTWKSRNADRIYRTGSGSGICQSYIAVDYGLFGDKARIRADFSAYLEKIRNSPKAEGCSRIYTHGEKEAESRVIRREKGIPVNEKTLNELKKIAADIGAQAAPFPSEIIQPND